MMLIFTLTLLMLLGCESFPAKYRKHHKHKRTHNRLSKALHPSHRILTYLQKEAFVETFEDAQDLKTFTSNFFYDLKRDQKSIHPSAFISLMEREQLFKKYDYAVVAKVMRNNHIKSIESELVFAELLSLTGLLLEEKAAAKSEEKPHVDFVEDLDDASSMKWEPFMS
jgi:hypothetical protein